MSLSVTNLIASYQSLLARYTLCEWFFYVSLLLPLTIRFFVMWKFRLKLSLLLSEEERAREIYRPYIYAYLAISTAVLLALTIANAKGEIHLKDAVFCAVISFIGFELALSMQTYKFKEFQHQLIEGIIDTARLALFLTVIAVLHSVYGLNIFSTIIMTLLTASYSMDFIIKLRYNWQILKG